MKRFLRHIAIYGLLVFAGLNALAWVSLYLLRNSSFYKPGFLTHEVKQNHFDYIVIGSSIGLTTLNTALIDSVAGTKGINLSIDDTSLGSHYLMLRHFYAQGKKTKFCVLAISHWDLANKTPGLNDNDYRFLPFATEPYVHDYYKKMEPGYFKPLALSRYFPAIGVASYNTGIFYPSIAAALQPHRRNRFDASGNYSYPQAALMKPKAWSAVTLQWENPFLDRVAALCRENGTRLIVYQAPVYNVNIVNHKKDIHFINHANALNEARSFYDEIHVNEYGRKLASAIFAKEFKAKYLNK